MPSPSPDIEVILLAAGLSRRMGAVDKLLLPVPGLDGGIEPMVRRSARLYRALGLPVTAVVGSAAVAEALAGLDLRIVTNPAPEHGQESSVRIGLEAAPLVASGVVIALSDLPWLLPADISALAAHFAALGGRKIVIPRHAGQRGNPPILPAALARRLRDDPGRPAPRVFVDAHRRMTDWHDSDSDHFIRDIDTPEDAATLAAGAPRA
jgi:molybdenum cofactor cytidylyltransferase